MIIFDDECIYSIEEDIPHVVNNIGICFLKTSSKISYKRLMDIGFKSMQMFYENVGQDIYSKGGCVANIINTEKQSTFSGIEGTIFQAEVFIAGSTRSMIEFLIHNVNVKAFHDYLIKNKENGNERSKKNYRIQ